MSPLAVLSHMALFSVMLVLTLIGHAGTTDPQQGGYLWQFLFCVCPFIMGMQIQLILNHTTTTQGE